MESPDTRPPIHIQIGGDWFYVRSMGRGMRALDSNLLEYPEVRQPETPDEHQLRGFIDGVTTMLMALESAGVPLDGIQVYDALTETLDYLGNRWPEEG